MKIHQVAAQLYTIREFIKTPAAIATSMQKIRAIGYQAVQVSGMGPIETDELRRILDGEGLTLCATHEPANTILDEPQRVVDRLQALDCKYTAYPHPAGIDLTDREQVKMLAQKLDRAGALLREAGQVLTYHNHAGEFSRIDDKPVLQLLYDWTEPNNLQGEIDTYWVKVGGDDPTDWCRKLANRLPLLHLKDYQQGPEGPDFAEIGYGTLDWNSIIPAAEASGCEWFIVEQDRTPGDPFDSLQKSFEFIAAKLVTA